MCAMRHESEGANRRMLKAAREFLGNGVCAADLAGNEAAFPMSLFMELFGEVRRLEMPFTTPCRRMRQRTEYFGCSAVWGIQDRTWDRTSRTKRGDRILPGQTDRD